MKGEARVAFEAQLKEEFIPKLRDAGFKGSGANFRRVNGEVINAINIQSSSGGDKCAVNLGLHLSFFPHDWKDRPTDPKKILEIDCEFRRRVSPPGKNDYWWDYRTLLSSPARNATDLCERYFAWGEPRFQAYDSVAKIAAMYSPDQLNESMANGFGEQTVARAALAMARVHAHLGDKMRAAQFARIGLKQLGRGTLLKPALDRLANLAP